MAAGLFKGWNSARDTRQGYRLKTGTDFLTLEHYIKILKSIISNIYIPDMVGLITVRHYICMLSPRVSIGCPNPAVTISNHSYN